jgi:hypothetical protein
LSRKGFSGGMIEERWTVAVKVENTSLACEAVIPKAFPRKVVLTMLGLSANTDM